MKDLFIAECRRFRNLACIAAAVWLVLLQFSTRVAEPLQQQWQGQTLFLLVSAVAGLAFAVFQFSGYRQPSRWLWLMHRPLPPSRIFGALALASFALLVFVVALPALLVIAGIDQYTGNTVDARHYLIPLHLLLTSFTAWLGGAYLMLSGRRGAFVVLFVPVLLSWHLASGAALLLPALLGVAVMAALAWTAFKPDRTAPPAGLAGRIAAGIPLVLGCYCLLLWGGAALFQTGQMLLGQSPINRSVPPPGGRTELIRTDGAGNLRRALKDAHDPRAAHWTRQLALLEVGKVEPEGYAHPVRGAIANLDKTQWGDGAHNIMWTFNHDHMMYEGRDMHTDAPRGWFGMNGMNDPQPFDSVPVIPGKFLMTRQHLLQLETETGRATTLVSVRAPEVLTGGIQEVGRQGFVLTNQRLIALRRNADPQARMEERYSVALPGPFGDLGRVDVARLLDGTLLSFNFGRRMTWGETGSRQHVLFVDTAGRVQTVSVRELAHDFPLLFEHRDWWLSPVVHAIATLPERLLDKGQIADAPSTPILDAGRPGAVLAAAVMASLLSAGLAAWRLRGDRPRRRLAWTAAALVLGPPGVAAMWILEPRLPRRPRTIPEPAAAGIPAHA